MENKDQYNQPGGVGEIPVTKPKQVATRTPTDIKLQQLEEQILNQHQEITKLRREITRLKNDVSDVITRLRRG